MNIENRERKRITSAIMAAVLAKHGTVTLVQAAKVDAAVKLLIASIRSSRMMEDVSIWTFDQVIIATATAVEASERFLKAIEELGLEIQEGPHS